MRLSELYDKTAFGEGGCVRQTAFWRVRCIHRRTGPINFFPGGGGAARILTLIALCVYQSYTIRRHSGRAAVYVKPHFGEFVVFIGVLDQFTIFPGGGAARILTLARQSRS